MAANTSITQTSGAISFSEIKAAFTNTSTSNSISDYRNKTQYTPGTGNTGTTPSGEISFSDFYNTVDLQTPALQEQQLNLVSNSFQLGGCAGGGVQGVNYRVNSSGVESIFAGGFYADYGTFGNQSFSNTFGGTTSSSGVQTKVGSGVTLGSNGRDTITLTLVGTLNGSDYSVQIFYQCKGGTYPSTPGGKPQVSISNVNPSITWSDLTS